MNGNYVLVVDTIDRAGTFLSVFAVTISRS